MVLLVIELIWNQYLSLTNHLIDWLTLGEDAVEEPAYPSNFGDVDKEEEEHHFKDPKKTLRGFFEREGY